MQQQCSLAAHADQALLGTPSHNQVHHCAAPSRWHCNRLSSILDTHDQTAQPCDQGYSCTLMLLPACLSITWKRAAPLSNDTSRVTAALTALKLASLHQGKASTDSCASQNSASLGSNTLLQHACTPSTLDPKHKALQADRVEVNQPHAWIDRRQVPVRCKRWRCCCATALPSARCAATLPAPAPSQSQTRQWRSTALQAPRCSSGSPLRRPPHPPA